MRKVALLAVACVALLCVTAQAQVNSATTLLDSPVKHEATYNIGETIVCSVALPGTAALFGTDTVSATVDQFITDELFGAFRVWKTDAACNILSSWSTAFPGSTMTGLASPNGISTQYWAIEPFAFAAQRYVVGTGAVVAGTAIPLPAGSLWGEAVVDNNQGGQVMCIDDIATDTYSCINVAAPPAAPFICSYANADNTGSGAFGNSVGDAVTPGDCSGATLIQATGTIGEGQVARVGQYNCTISDPNCTDTWSVGQFSTFVNGVEEFDAAGSKNLAVVDNVTSVWLILAQPIGIGDCQDIDANMDLVYVNGGQGTSGNGFNVDVDEDSVLSVAVQKTPAGNGKFVHHMNAGTPNSGTVAKLLDLGNNCFPFLGGSPSVIENNVGKTNQVGVTNYFGSPRPDPAKAPTFLASLNRIAPVGGVIDAVNMPTGSQFTHQGIHLNGAASSSKGGSLTNGVVMTIQP